LVVDGPTNNVRYDVRFTNALGASPASWPLLVTGAPNQVVFDLPMPDPTAGFFAVIPNDAASTAAPPQAATADLGPPSFTGDTPVVDMIGQETPNPLLDDPLLGPGGFVWNKSFGLVNQTYPAGTSQQLQITSIEILDKNGEWTKPVGGPPKVFGGMAVRIIGKGFGNQRGTLWVSGSDEGAALFPRFGDTTWWKDTEIVAHLPNLAPGLKVVAVKTKGGQSISSDPIRLEYLELKVADQWIWPRESATLSQSYGYNNTSGKHTGLDVFSENGNTKVFAAAAGIVVAKCQPGRACPGYSSNNRNHNLQGVMILAHRLADGQIVYSLYGHLGSVDANLAPGQTVTMGQVLGTIGGGGHRHVHFEVKSSAVLHNPQVPPEGGGPIGDTHRTIRISMGFVTRCRSCRFQGA
jgi:hypothetical protein